MQRGKSQRTVLAVDLQAKPAPGFGVPLFDLSEPGLLQSPFQNTRSRSKLPR